MEDIEVLYFCVALEYAINKVQENHGVLELSGQMSFLSKLRMLIY